MAMDLWKWDRWRQEDPQRNIYYIMDCTDSEIEKVRRQEAHDYQIKQEQARIASFNQWQKSLNSQPCDTAGAVDISSLCPVGQRPLKNEGGEVRRR